MPTTASTTTMRAVVQDGYGTADVLRTEQVAQPTIRDHEVRVRVHAAGLNRGTWHIMSGTPYALRLAFGLRRPRQPVIGNELAGTVVDVGADGHPLRPPVTRSTGSAPAPSRSTPWRGRTSSRPSPTNLTFEQAAIVPISAPTALQALTDIGHVQAGQRVLVTGASGGVGSFAVQIAKALGAHVTAECSTAKADLVRSLGADEVVDYTRDDFADGSRRFDLIIDLAGGPSVARLRAALTPTGTAVLAGGEQGGNLTGMGRQIRAALLSPFVRQRLTLCVTKERAARPRAADGADRGAARSPRHWTRPTRSTGPPTRCGAWSPATCAARSRSPSRPEPDGASAATGTRWAA